MRVCLLLLLCCVMACCGDTASKRQAELEKLCHVVSFSVGYENPTCGLVCWKANLSTTIEMALPVSCAWKNQPLKVDIGAPISKEK